MNSLLYPQPEGALMDPRSQAIMQMGLGLMSAGGPQSTPMGLGQAFGQAGQQGLQAFQQAQQAQQQEAFRQLQMKKMEEQMAMERQRLLQASQPRPQSLAPGGMLVGPDGKVIVQAPFKPEAPQKPTPPMTRTVQMGGEKVTQEYVNGEWTEIGRGPMFQPVKPAAAPKAPTGFRYKPDSDELEPIPGGPKDTSPKDAARAAGAVQKADTVIAKVDEALSQVGFSSTGLTGTVLGMVPGTKAYDLDKTIDTIKANLGFSELQAMREASPTGGALGQVAIQELAMLQSTIASLDKGQSPENLKRGLEQVRKHFQNWKNAVLESQKGQASPAAPAAPKRKVFNPANGKFE